MAGSWRWELGPFHSIPKLENKDMRPSSNNLVKNELEERHENSCLKRWRGLVLKIKSAFPKAHPMLKTKMKSPWVGPKGAFPRGHGVVSLSWLVGMQAEQFSKIPASRDSCSFQTGWGWWGERKRRLGASNSLLNRSQFKTTLLSFQGLHQDPPHSMWPEDTPPFPGLSGYHTGDWEELRAQPN